MAAESGRQFVLQVQVSSTWTTVAGLTANSMTISNEPVDVSTKGSRFRILLEGAGTSSMELSANGVFDDDQAFKNLRNAAQNNSHISCRMVFSSGDVIEGNFMAGNLQFSGDNGGAVNYQLTLQSAGSWTYTG
jgi:TP901-1 family phage major tail protein